MVDLLIFISTLLLGVLMTLVGLEMAGDKNVVERKRRYRWIFGCLGVAFMILSIFQFVRSDGAAKRAEQERHAAELRNEGNFKYQQGQLDTTNKILAEMAKNSDPKQIATALANALPKTTPSPGSSGVQPPALERMTDRQLREKVIEFANDVRKFVKQWHDREITVSRDFENREMNAKDDAERHQIREEETSSYLYRTLGYPLHSGSPNRLWFRESLA